METHHFVEHRLANCRVLGGQRDLRRIRFESRALAAGFRQRVRRLLGLPLRFLDRGRLLLGFRLVAGGRLVRQPPRRRRSVRGGPFKRRQFRHEFVVADQRMHQTVQPRKLRHRVGGVLLRAAKVFVTVNDHAELRAPIAEMVVADDMVAAKSQQSAQRVADHRGTDMADMHRLGDVGRREVDDILTWRGRAGDPEKRIGERRDQRLRQQVVSQPEVDEAWTGHFHLLA